jgi:hypothetical protein
VGAVVPIHLGGIASYIGRKSGDLAHPLNVLQDCGLIVREPDVFKENRSTFRIAEPLISFYHAVMRPIWSDLEHTRDASRLWERSQPRFAGSVLGPHFEQVCRHWTQYFATEEALGGIPIRVGTGSVNDPAARTSHELDVVVFGLADEGPEPVLAIGEAKWNEVMSVSHLDRLRRIRDLLAAQGRTGAAKARLMCFSGAGFTDGLAREAAAAQHGVALVGPADLYGNSASHRGLGVAAEPGGQLGVGGGVRGDLDDRTEGKSGIWYLVADQDGEPRLFRVSRVVSAEADEAPVRRRDGVELAELWQALRRQIEERPTPLGVTARVRREWLGVFCRICASHLVDGEDDDGGDDPEWAVVRLRFGGVAAARILLSFGGDAEVVSPPEVRDDLAAVAAATVELYHRTRV